MLFESFLLVERSLWNLSGRTHEGVSWDGYNLWSELKP